MPTHVKIFHLGWLVTVERAAASIPRRFSPLFRDFPLISPEVAEEISGFRGKSCARNVRGGRPGVNYTEANSANNGRRICPANGEPEGGREGGKRSRGINHVPRGFCRGSTSAAMCETEDGGGRAVRSRIRRQRGSAKVKGER